MIYTWVVPMMHRMRVQSAGSPWCLYLGFGMRLEIAHFTVPPLLDQPQHSYTIHYACPYICSSRQSPFRIYHIPLNLSEWKIDWCGGGWNGERWSGREVIPFICKNWNETYIILEDFIGNYDNDIEYSSIFLMINFYYKI